MRFERSGSPIGEWTAVVWSRANGGAESSPGLAGRIEWERGVGEVTRVQIGCSEAGVSFPEEGEVASGQPSGGYR